MILPDYGIYEAQAYEKTMSNWSYLALELPQIMSEEVLLKMVRFEMETKQRVYIIDRLLSRHNSIRNRRERAEFLKSF